jgi:hypothetical protein
MWKRGVWGPRLGLGKDHDSLSSGAWAKTAAMDQASYPVLSKELVLRG